MAHAPATRGSRIFFSYFLSSVRVKTTSSSLNQCKIKNFDKITHPYSQGRPSIFSRGGKDSSPSPKGRRPAGLLMTTSGAGVRGRSPQKNFAFPPLDFQGGEGFSDPFLGKIDTSRTQFLRYMKSIIQVLSQDKKLLISTITTQ